MKIKNGALILIPIFLITACQPFPSASGVSATPVNTVAAQLVASEEDIVDFGWLSDGRVFYGIGGDPEVDSLAVGESIGQTHWFAIDPASRAAVEIPRPYPALNEDQMMALGKDWLQEMTISPSGDKALFTRLPTGFQRPEDFPPHYFDPAEIWSAEDLSAGPISTYPILNDPERQHACGVGLARESRWYEDESLVLGLCLFDAGIIHEYFLADLRERTIQFLDFATEDGAYVPSEEIAAAHKDPDLAFYSGGRLWLVSAESRQIPLTLRVQNILFEDGPAINPAWSLDDRWIYFWTTGETIPYEGNGVTEYTPWWLERIDPVTRTREVVLGHDQLLRVLGYEMYGVPIGGGQAWRLSPDEKQILLYMRATVKSPAALLLITY